MKAIKRKATTSTGKQNLPPRLPRFLLGALTPREVEQEFIEDFDELYESWVVPTYGNWAPWWAWMQVLKTTVVMTREVVSEFWGRGKKQAR